MRKCNRCGSTNISKYHNDIWLFFKPLKEYPYQTKIDCFSDIIEQQRKEIDNLKLQLQMKGGWTSLEAPYYLDTTSQITLFALRPEGNFASSRALGGRSVHDFYKDVEISDQNIYVYCSNTIDYNHEFFYGLIRALHILGVEKSRIYIDDYANEFTKECFEFAKEMF